MNWWIKVNKDDLLIQLVKYYGTKNIAEENIGQEFRLKEIDEKRNH